MFFFYRQSTAHQHSKCRDAKGAATRDVLQEKVFWEISENSQENICARISFLIKLQADACNHIKKETLTQVFFCEFYEISKNSFFTEHLWVTASDTTVCRYFNRCFIWLYQKILRDLVYATEACSEYCQASKIEHS